MLGKFLKIKLQCVVFPLLTLLFSIPPLFSAEPSEILIKSDYNYPPFEFRDEKGQAKGFNVDIVQAIANEMGRKIRIKTGVWEEIKSELKTGQIDGLAGMYKTRERAKYFDFSVPHFIASYAIFVRKGSAIKTLDDLKGKTILVQKDDLGHEYAVENNISTRISPMSDWGTVLHNLSIGKGDAAIISRLQGKEQIFKKRIRNIKVVGPTILQRKYCIAVQKGNASLLAELNEGLSIIKKSGAYDKIYEKWFGAFEKEPITFIDALIYISWVAIPVGGLMVIGFIWSWMLKKEVNKKTRELKKELVIRKKLENEKEILNLKLKEKNQELEQIIFVSSHDLRSPLVNVQGFSRELDNSIKDLTLILEKVTFKEDIKAEIDEILNDNISEAIHFIYTGISKMDALLTALLRFSRSGRASLTIEPVDLNILIKEIVRSFEYQLKEKEVTPKIAHLPVCVADKIQINHVFSNLIDNAIKFSDPNRPLQIEIGGYLKGKDTIYFVKDNGIGISGEHQKRIFEIFYRLHPNKSEGQGLGMTIVRKVLSRMDGKVWVNSELGKGTTFFFSLPTGEA